MSYKSILVHLNDKENVNNLLAAGCGLAERYQAHLTGLFVLPPVIVPAVPEIAYRDDLMEAHRSAWREEEQATRALFDQATNDQSYVAQWHFADAGTRTSASIVAEQARTADLAIVSQSEPESGSRTSLTVERTVMDGGRPVLLMPSAGEFAQIGSQVLVAWNGQRESARAVFDALPLLKDAGRVHILTVDPPGERKPIDIPGADIAVALSRHGVSCETAKVVVAGVSVGDTLLNFVSDNGIDLIVMGCYGHTRLRELVFGGTTKTVLSDATAPVLMSH